MNIDYKKIGIWALLSLMIFIVLWLLITYLKDGKLVVTTNDSEAEVTVAKAKSDEPSRRIGHGNSKEWLSPGFYTVEVVSGEQRSRVAIEIKRRKTVTKDVDILPLKTIEQAANYTARNIFATDKSITFLNTPAKQLFRLNFGQSEATRYLPELFPIVKSYWVGVNKAVVESPNGMFRLIDNQKVKILNLPLLHKPESLAISQSGNIAFTSEGYLFYQEGLVPKQRQTEPFEPIEPNIISAVALAENGMMAVYYPPGDVHEAEDQKDSAPEPTAFIINTSTKEKTDLPNTGGGSIQYATWNPSGTKLLYFDANGAQVFEVQTKQGRSVLGARPTNISGFSWISDQKLVYIDQNTIWLYNDETEISAKVGDVQRTVSQSDPFSVSSDGQYIYFGTDAAAQFGSVGTIYRFSP